MKKCACPPVAVGKKKPVKDTDMDMMKCGGKVKMKCGGKVKKK